MFSFFVRYLPRGPNCPDLKQSHGQDYSPNGTILTNSDTRPSSGRREITPFWVGIGQREPLGSPDVIIKASASASASFSFARSTLPREGVIRQAPPVEAAAPYGAPPCEDDWPVPAPEAEDLEELLLGW